jgi:hypothetical protein
MKHARGTSCLARTRVARAVPLGVQLDCSPNYRRPACGRRPPRRDPRARPARESLRTRAARAVPNGLWIADAGGAGRGLCGPPTARRSHARGSLGPGRCAGGVQPVLKRVVAVAGDVMECGPEAVTVNGQRLPGSSTGSLGRRETCAQPFEELSCDDERRGASDALSTSG